MNKWLKSQFMKYIKPVTKIALFILLSVATVVTAADSRAPLAKKGKLLFSDDFARRELGTWKAVIPTFTVADGVLKGSQTRDDHGSVGSIRAGVAGGVAEPFKDVVIEFKFRLEGARNINAVCDDKTFKGSHAGHICRVAITPKQIRLGDDKEGVMRNDIYELRKDPARKAEADKLLVGRAKAFPAKIEPQRWYRMAIEIVGDEMRVSVDDQAVGHLKSPGLAHATKNEFHFTVSGKDALFDDVRIWAAAPTR
ncbi:MAG: hypothetical protein AB1705_17075 [Verrucomicrobiota bacterium]